MVMRRSLYRLYFKRFIDLTISLTAFILLLPLFLLLMLILTIVNKGSPFFIQERPGLGEKLFKIIKFKTMNDERDEKGNLLPDEKRLTPIGKFIRSTSLDEIPQLINVIKGEMSLVGPRPLLVEYIPLYSAKQRRRHEVKPGITGWAQVNGRNAITWEQKFEADIYYVDHVSFWLDLRILFLTLLKVLKREGIRSAQSVTMEKFKGNEIE